MIQIDDITYKADKNKIFIDKETKLINYGDLIQIGVVYINNEEIEDSIDNYEEILLKEFEKDNEINYIKNIEK